MKSSRSHAKKLSLAALILKQHFDADVLQFRSHTQRPSAIQSTYKLLEPLKCKKVFEFIQNK